MKKSVKRALIISALIVSLILAAVLFREYICNYFIRMQMDDIEADFSGARLLVFAPHCDDEVLGAAELIDQVVKSGGSVEVVLMTNGDGDKYAVELEYHKLHIQADNYISFGYQRQQESATALKQLGVDSGNIVYLGYPDGGLSDLWDGNWSCNNLYYNSFTQTDHTPYDNSYTKGVAYCGENVACDVMNVIEDFQPDYIVYPHTNDAHRDHWATYNFVKYALTLMDYHPEKEWLYLVHQGEWPVPMEKRPQMYLVPPARLADNGTTWLALPLDQDDQVQKERLIGIYESQTALTGTFLYAFVRKNELFGEYPSFQMIRQSGTDEAGLFNTDSKNLVLSEPESYYVRLEMDKKAFVHGVYPNLDRDDTLYFTIEMGGDIEKSNIYQLCLVFFVNEAATRLKLKIKEGAVVDISGTGLAMVDPGRIKLMQEQNKLYLALPMEDFDSVNHILVNMALMKGTVTFDRSAWRMVDIVNDRP